MKKSSKPKSKQRKVANRRTQSTPKVAPLKFLPAVLILLFSVFIHITPSFAAVGSSDVLGYATSVSISGLYSGTNSQRSANGVATLNLNNALNSAAQAKADDMVARDYWSHNTPDGQQPWVFFTQAGYNYKAAGENLAYGFATSSDTITGWMNSPAHRDNLLKTTFYDVGFGIANSVNYVGTGEETVVVAMYGAQQGASAPAVAPASTSPPTATTQTTKTKTVAPTPAPVTAEPIESTPAPAPVETPTSTPSAENAVENETTPIAVTASPMKVRRIQLMTGGNAKWSATLLALSVFSIGLLWILHRGLHLRRLLLNGERFVLHHLHLDFTVFALLVLGWSLLGTSGIIR